MSAPQQSKVVFAHLAADMSAVVIKMQLPDAGGQLEKQLDLAGTVRLIHQLADGLAQLTSRPVPALVHVHERDGRE